MVYGKYTLLDKANRFCIFLYTRMERTEIIDNVEFQQTMRQNIPELK